MVEAFAILVGIISIGIPSVLMVLLIFHGEKSRRSERPRLPRREPPKRGFEVIFRNKP